MKEKGVTVSIAAEILGITPHTLRTWDKKGILPARRGKNGFRYYRITDLEKFKRKMGRV